LSTVHDSRKLIIIPIRSIKRRYPLAGGQLPVWQTSDEMLNQTIATARAL